MMVVEYNCEILEFKPRSKDFRYVLILFCRSALILT